MSFKPVLAAESLWDGEMIGALVDGQRVLVVAVNGELFAYEDRCPHKGIPLSAGSLLADTLTCTAHSWQFDATSGQGLNPKGCRLKAFPVQRREGQILVDVEPAGAEVGPVLSASPQGKAVLAAIKRLNPQARVVDRGAYWRVLVPQRCIVTRRAIVEEGGEDMAWPGGLEAVMPAFKGRLSFSEEQALWSAGSVTEGRTLP